MPWRKDQIIQEIRASDSDTIALQEVKDKAFSETLAEAAGYPHHCFSPMEDKPFGLALFSKHPIKDFKYSDHALFVRVDRGGKTMLFVNVHLPDASVLAQGASIINISKTIPDHPSDYRFILGDFYCSEMSSVHQYLLGTRSLEGTEVDRYWTDLASVAEEFLGVKKEMTLDLLNNPRWKGRPLTDNSVRVDTVFFHDCFPNPYPVLETFGYFRKEIDREDGYCASDHYGVYADLKMPSEKERPYHHEDHTIKLHKELYHD